MIDGAKIRYLREKSGLTMKELGVQVGISEAAVSCLERNLKDVSVANLKRIADVFHVPLDDLLSETREVMGAARPPPY